MKILEPVCSPEECDEAMREARDAAAVLKNEKLRVEFRSQEVGQPLKVAVKDLSLSVLEGEVFGFLGPNGAGKTTTMNVLLGFVNAMAGNAFLFGENVRNPIARQRIGYLPELTYYYKFLTAEELLRFYAKIFKVPKAEREKRIDAVLKLVELDHARKRQIKTYSKGMQQRAGLAQALINNPDLLILDEPTSGLDPVGRMKVREIIQRLKDEGKTVFFSSHELGEVETVCDRVAILHQGELKAEGRVSDIVARHQCNLEEAFLRIIGFKPAAVMNSERLPSPASLPLPSTGRGNEGEGWFGPAHYSAPKTLDAITPHPNPLPVEGRGSSTPMAAERLGQSNTH
jgi:ABC-type multidrug transport system ATPase subunit